MVEPKQPEDPQKIAEQFLLDLQKTFPKVLDRLEMSVKVLEQFAPIYKDRVKFWEEYVKETGGSEDLLESVQLEVESLSGFDFMVGEISKATSAIRKLSDALGTLEVT
jgi:hypothetical protein